MTGSSFLIATTLASSVFAGVLLALVPRLPGLVAQKWGTTTGRWGGGSAITLLALVLMMVGGGLAIDKWGIRPVLLGGLLAALLGLALLERSGGKLLAAVLCAVTGAAAGAAVTATVLLMGQVGNPDHPAASMNLGFIGLTLGALLTPPVAGWLTGRFGVGKALPVLALLGLVPAALANFTPLGDFPIIQTGDHLEQLLEHRHLWLLAGLVVCYQAIEASLPGWSSIYLNDLGMPAPNAGVVLLTSAGIWFAVGQAAAAYSLQPGWEVTMIVLLLICLGILLGNTLGNDRPLSGVVGLVVAFACIGPLLPTILGLAIQRYPAGQAPVVGMLLGLNALAGTIFSPLGRPSTGPQRDRSSINLCMMGIFGLILMAIAFGFMP